MGTSFPTGAFRRERISGDCNPERGSTQSGGHEVRGFWALKAPRSVCSLFYFGGGAVGTGLGEESQWEPALVGFPGVQPKG